MKQYKDFADFLSIWLRTISGDEWESWSIWPAKFFVNGIPYGDDEYPRSSEHNYMCARNWVILETCVCQTVEWRIGLYDDALRVYGEGEWKNHKAKKNRERSRRPGALSKLTRSITGKSRSLYTHLHVRIEPVIRMKKNTVTMESYVLHQADGSVPTATTSSSGHTNSC
jgi:hypothetical protein